MKKVILILVASCFVIGMNAQSRTPKDKVDYIKTFVTLDNKQSQKLEDVFTKYSSDVKAALAQDPNNKEKIDVLKKNLSEDLKTVMGKTKYDEYVAGMRKEMQEARNSKECSSGSGCDACPSKCKK